MTSLDQTAPRRNALEGLDLRLTAGGALIYRRTRRPTETCNLLASLAGMSMGEDRSR